MAVPGSKRGVRSGTGRRRRFAGKPSFTTIAFFIGFDRPQPKGAVGAKLKIPDAASKLLTNNPRSIKALLQGYASAIAKSRMTGRRVGLRVDVDPEGRTIMTRVEETAQVAELTARDTELQAALAAARDRGRLRAAEILAGEDMLSADAFAEMLGTTRVTVNTKRQSGQVLGLDGAKRGFRFPVWQLDADGKPFAELAGLHERLGGPWAVYRFLVQPQGELGGLTGREALTRRKVKAVLEAAEAVGRNFR